MKEKGEKNKGKEKRADQGRGERRKEGEGEGEGREEGGKKQADRGEYPSQISYKSTGHIM